MGTRGFVKKSRSVGGHRSDALTPQQNFDRKVLECGLGFVFGGSAIVCVHMDKYNGDQRSGLLSIYRPMNREPRQFSDLKQFCFYIFV